MRQRIIGAGFALFGATGLHRLAPSGLRGLGAILMLHHVRPAATDAFRPNGLLEITPTFLDALIVRLRGRGYDFVSMDEAVERVRAQGAAPARPFVALTFDDGLRDNCEHALPVMEKHGTPFAVFVTPGFADRTARLWWLDLEEAIRRSPRIEVEIGDEALSLPAATPHEKQLAWDAVYTRLRRGGEARLRAVVERLCVAAGVDRAAIAAQACLDWEEVAALAHHPLVTVGAHTMTHPRLAKLDQDEMMREMGESRGAIEARIGRAVRHLAYPVGDPTSAGRREFAAAAMLGFESAVTTRPGLVFPEHVGHLTALPRLSVNGNWQDLTSMEVLLSGAAFALWNRGRKVNAA